MFSVSMPIFRSGWCSCLRSCVPVGLEMRASYTRLDADRIAQVESGTFIKGRETDRH